MAKCGVDFILMDSACKGIQDGTTRALVQTADFINGDTIQRKAIPFDNGILQNSRKIIQDPTDKLAVHIAYGVPYDVYVYEGSHMNFQKVNNANAQAFWLKAYEKGGDRNQAAQDFMISRTRIETSRYLK